MKESHQNIVRNLVSNKFYEHLKQGDLVQARQVIKLARQMSLKDLEAEFEHILTQYNQSDFQGKSSQTG